MGQDQGERLAALEAKFELGHSAIMGEIKQMREDSKTQTEQLRKMHSDHYAKNEAQGLQINEIASIAKSAKLEIGEHNQSHWKWFVFVVGTAISLAGLISKLMGK